MAPNKRQQTLREVVSRFGGCRTTWGARPAYEGLWEQSGKIFRDRIRSLIVEAPVRARHYEWLRRYKQTLESRFQQIEIYISVTDIKRIV